MIDPAHSDPLDGMYAIDHEETTFAFFWSGVAVGLITAAIVYGINRFLS